MRAKSKALFEEAKKIIPGGVNSPVRAGKSVGMDPPFITSAKGALIVDADGTHGELRHGSHHERHSTGKGLHGPGQNREI